MKKLLQVLFIILLLSTVLFAQNTTTTTGTIQYPDGSLFANGTVLATFTPPGGVINQNQYTINGATFPYYVSGVMNGSGTFSLTLTDDHKVRPQGGRWMFTVCSLASTSCNNSLQDVFGASIDLSANINGSIANILGGTLNVPRFYTDSEVLTTSAGGLIYYNLTSNTFRCYNGIAWNNCITGGGGTTWPSITFPTASNTLSFTDSQLAVLNDASGGLSESWFGDAYTSYTGIRWEVIAKNIAGTFGGAVKVYDSAVTCNGVSYTNGAVVLEGLTQNTPFCIGDDGSGTADFITFPDGSTLDSSGAFLGNPANPSTIRNTGGLGINTGSTGSGITFGTNPSNSTQVFTNQFILQPSSGSSLHYSQTFPGTLIWPGAGGGVGTITLGGGWGTGASVLVKGHTNDWHFTITAGTSPTINPTFTLNYIDAFTSGEADCIIQQVGGNDVYNTAPIQQTSNLSTGGVFTWPGTPTNTKQYTFTAFCFGTS